MKRIAAIAGLLLIATLGLAAAVWDGSAVAGVAGDFPDDGYYGACNSFPRDTSVTVTNLENGKSVTVTITRNVDNPGVFIALSPKAAADLGMRAGSATRIRAVALVASQAESSLPPTRAGESADPDYNPKVYVEREKAAVAAAAATPPAEAPKAGAQPSAPSPEVALKPSATSPALESAEVMARVGEPKKQPAPELPTLTEPRNSTLDQIAAAPAVTPAPAPAPIPTPAPAPAPAAPAAVAAVTPPQPEKVGPSKVPADSLPAPETSPTFPGSPRPSPLGMSLPAPDLPSVPPSAEPIAHGGYLAQAPEVIGGETKPSPRKPSPPRLVFIDPPLPSPTEAASTPAAKASEVATIDALKRPAARRTPYGVILAEPKPEFGPDELPDAVLSRVTAPTKVVPNPVLAEAEAPKSLGDLRTKPEAIVFDKPSYSEEVEAALAEASIAAPAEAYSVTRPDKAGGEEVVADLAEASLPGSPDAISDRRIAEEGGALSELQVPDLPRPIEGIAAERPQGRQAEAVAGDLAEPGVSTPQSTGMGPAVIADLRKGPQGPAAAALSDPNVPTPSESLTAGKAKSVEPGQAVAELAEPDPSGKGISAIGGAKPAMAAVQATGDLASPVVPSPSESIAAEHPAAVAKKGEKIVTLEPALPRPPAAAAAAAPTPAPTPSPAPAAAPAKPSQPAAVATVTSPTPNGAVQAPASVPILKGLAKGSYYVQIGVYGTNDALKTAVAGFKSTHYPLAVEKLTTKKGSAAFRLFVGPLSRDESGLVLIRIRSLGYKDAYIRQGT
jgi:hypothetical protein